MGRIRELPTVLINQIAAGEVIARPASVVKELVENAIDAGATHLRVEIDNHCRNVAVIDDGEGMSPDDAQMAILRHATSKIHDLDDLRSITTRGFRGEALASVAAVSRLEILTRHADDVAGYRIMVEGGEVTSKGPVGCAPGTAARVRDLFFNTPARRKFLKSEATELNAIMQLLTRQMLSRGELGFTIVRDGRKIIELPTDQPLGPRMVHLLGNLAESQLVKVNSDRHGVRIYGYVTRPDASRKDRREQYFFVNGRPVTHRSMGYSLGQAYHGLLMNGRYPISCLFIDLAPEEIDVNVHPTKEEIRFREEGKVTGVLNHAIVDALRRANLTPQMRLPGGEGDFAQQARQLGFEIAPPGEAALAPPSEAALAPPAPLPYSGRIKADRIDLPPPEKPRFPQRDRTAFPFPFEKRTDAYPSERPAPASPATRAEAAPSAAPPSATPPETVAPGGAGETVPAVAPAIEGDPLGLTRPRPLGQAGDSYVIATIGDGLVIVDQHAAHERINFNRIMKMLERGGADSQPLLMPLTFDVAAGDVGRVERFLPLLKQTGVDVEHFGGRTYVARSVPAAMPNLDVVGLVQDLLSEEGEGGGLRNATPREELAARMACHASIKANQRLSPDEMRLLLAELASEPNASTCPHGRPTMIRLSREELDRQFGR